MSDFLGSLVLSQNMDIDDTNQDYQFVYASQNYGTLYGIYAKFEVSNKILKKISLFIQNYQGAPRIGFMPDISTYQDPEDIPLQKGNEINIILPVIAMNSNNTEIITLNPTVDIDSFNIINFQRMLYPINEEFTNSKIIFDSEFYYTDDEENLREREERPGIYHSSHDEERIAGRNCHTSRMKVNLI